jgi:putative phosphoribosyl transferase
MWCWCASCVRRISPSWRSARSTKAAGPIWPTLLDYLESEKRAQMETIRQRRAQYTPIRPPIDPAGRIVIVIDDGLATGATMISALHGLRAMKPAQLICAVPVAPPDTLAKVADLADEVVCLEAPRMFQAVGQFYRYFPQVDDDEVIALLKGS